ncbi:MAG: hypothetical protein GY704_14460, partial [Phycisphaeraceae bacterium]|nr:hypothetical protein [Phycisphaeraceae bacterium]
FQWTHGQQLVPEYLDVPLIIRSPRHDFAAPRYDAVTRSIDLYPTLAGLCGVPLDDGSGVQGQDLSPALLGEISPPELPAYSHTTLLSPHAWKDVEGWEHYRRFFPRMDPELMWVRVREGDLVAKWRRRADGTWETEIFDLATDPGERHDLFDPTDARHAELTQRLQRYRERLLASYRPPSAEDGLSDEEALRRLRDLLLKQRSLCNRRRPHDEHPRCRIPEQPHGRSGRSCSIGG